MLNEIRKAIEHLTTALLIRLNKEENIKERSYEINEIAREIVKLTDIYMDIETGEKNI